MKDLLEACSHGAVAGISIGLFVLLPAIVVYVLGALGIWGP